MSDYDQSLQGALEYAVDLASPDMEVFYGNDGTEYVRNHGNICELTEYKRRDKAPETMSTSTLSSVVDFLMHDIDGGTYAAMDRSIIHVVSPHTVMLTTEVKETGQRWDRLIARAHVNTFNFDQYMERENFNVSLLTDFEDSGDRADVLACIGRLSSSTVTEGADDGITQSASIRQGVQRSMTVDIKNPVTLTPYRTFPEATQPESGFVLRLKSGQREGEMPTVALFECDGSMWKNQAIENIKLYFRATLPPEMFDENKVVIIG